MIPTPSRHPLRREGTAQAARENAALNPAAGLLDDRDLARLLDTAAKAAELLTFANTANHPDGNWRDFIANTVPGALARLSLVSSRDLQRELAALKQPAPTEDNLLPLARRLRALCVELDNALRVFKREKAPFTELIERAIAHRLSAALFDLIKNSPVKHRAEWNAARSLIQAAPWGVDNLDAPSAGITAVATAAALETLANAIVSTTALLTASAEAELEAATADTGNRPPHIGLVLAFLELFGVAQAGLDDLVRRHLEFYYTEKLLIRPRGPQMDRAFVLFQPVKGTPPQVIEKGTPLFAGRDSAKADIHFALVRDASVNAATVAELRSTCVRSSDGSLRFAAVANSGDGIGKEPAPESGWHPMGHADLPVARHGCALSGPIFRLAGGTKRITITFQLATATGLPASLPDSFVSVRYTGPKGWISVPDANRAITLTGTNLVVTLGTLGPEHIFAAYSADTHARGYTSEFPIVEIEAAFASASARGDLLSGREVRRITIECAVTGDPHLVLANDNGAIDGAKPFQPFGPAPVSKNAARSEEGSHFYVGSQAIFANRLTHFALNLKWKDKPEDESGSLFYLINDKKGGSGGVHLAMSKENKAAPSQKASKSQAGPFGNIGKQVEQAAEVFQFTEILSREEDTDSYSVTAAYLDRADWLPDSPTKKLFRSDAMTLPPPALAPQPDLPAISRPVPGLLRGFIRLTLVSPVDAFGHATYSRRVGDLVLANLTPGEDGKPPPQKKLPPPPISPSLSAITADWTAVAEWNVSDGTNEHITLFHIEPHGEWHVASSPAVWPSPEYAGALLIGLRDAAPRTNVSLLIHLADGSGDPFVRYPAVDWHYLAGDRWLPFDNAAILHDSTNDLRRTGIFTFTIPAAATTAHSRMPAGLLWIRAGANEPLTALNRAHTITAQAAEAVFAPKGNDLTRLAAPLPAGSIARLTSPRPGIKKVLQPLATFGGRTAEQGAPFYRRVSERLRHRGRAVTAWDYERLVLEKFDDVFLAKCVPHAAATSELAPGEVLVVVVPKLDGSAAFNPLTPGVSQDRLAEIESFLRARTPGLATIRVVNPRYEEIRVVAAVGLVAGVDETVHRERLNGDLRRLLAPWAYGGTAQFSFTEQVFPSSILNFIEELPYVDFVKDFRVEQTIGGTPTTPDRLRPTTSHSILVSAEQHTITRA